MTDTSPSIAVVRWRLPTIALVASLAVNLLLAGLIAGSFFWSRHHPGPGAYAGNPWGFIRTLPNEQRQAIRQAARAEIQAAEPLRQNVRAARAETDRILTTEPFDKAQFLAAQLRLLEAEADIRKAGAKAFSETAATLSPDDRKRLVKWRERELHSNSRRGGGGDGPRADGRPEPKR